MNGKKIAQIVDTSANSKLIIERVSEDKYLVTDTYVFMVMDEKTYLEFKYKYSSYNKTPYIPDIAVGEEKNYNGHDWLDGGVDFTIFTKNQANLRPARLTPFIVDDGSGEQMRVFRTEYGPRIYKNIYHPLLDDKRVVKVKIEKCPKEKKEKFPPVYGLDNDDNVLVVVMPVRQTGNKISLEDHIQLLASRLEVVEA